MTDIIMGNVVPLRKEIERLKKENEQLRKKLREAPDKFRDSLMLARAYDPGRSM